MAKKLDWIVETAADEAALQERISALRLAGHDVQEGDVFYNGTDYTIKYLVHHNHIAVNVAIGSGIISTFQEVAANAGDPWTASSPYDMGNYIGNYVSFAAFPNNSFLMAYATGWLDDGEGDWRKIQDKLRFQIADSDGNEIKASTQIGESTYWPDVCTLDNGNVVVAWIDTNYPGANQDAVSFMIIDSDGNHVVATTIVGTTSGVTTSPCVVNLDTGGFMVLYCPLSSSHLQTVVYDAAGTETARPAQITAVNFDGSQINCEKNNAGEVVMAYIDTSGDFGYATIAADGTLDTDVGVITTATLANKMPQVCVLTDNNYFFSWYDGDTGGAEYAIYSNLDAEVKAPAALPNYEPYATIALTNGGAMVLTARNGGGWNAHFYDAAGALDETVFVSTAGRHNESIICPNAVQLKNERIAVCSSVWQTASYFSILTGTR